MPGWPGMSALTSRRAETKIQATAPWAVRHWDGKAWRVVVPPRAFINSPLDQGVAAVAASSGSNAWVLAARGTDEVACTDALHLTGTRWASPVRLDAGIQAAVAPSPTQLWAFGEPSSSRSPGYFAHFDGRTWTHGSFPFSGTAAAARSASDVWVGGGGDDTGRLGIEHGDGHRWHATPLPNLRVASSDLLWATASGAGGNTVMWFDHYADGRWSRVKVPSGDGVQPEVFYLNWIPGTRSLWAAGEVDFANDGKAVLKYGP
jgi:hypothetical protein